MDRATHSRDDVVDDRQPLVERQERGLHRVDRDPLQVPQPPVEGLDQRQVVEVADAVAHPGVLERHLAVAAGPDIGAAVHHDAVEPFGEGRAGQGGDAGGTVRAQPGTDESTSVVLVSHDDGASWEQVEGLTDNGWFNSISCASTQNCWAGGAGTTEGGVSWPSGPTPTTSSWAPR